MTTKDSFPWPHEAVAMLRKYWADNASASYIAGRINAEFRPRVPVTRNGVIGKVHRLRLKKSQADVRRARATGGKANGGRNSDRLPKPGFTREQIQKAVRTRKAKAALAREEKRLAAGIQPEPPAPRTQTPEIIAPATDASNWTPEREATLTKLWKAGLTSTQIASRLGGVTRHAVVSKAHRLGLERPAAITELNRRTRGYAPSVSTLTGAMVHSRDAIDPTPLPAPEAPDPKRKTITLEELTVSSCRWPFDPTPDDPQWRYCGCERDRRSIRSAYCTEHWLRSISSERRGRKRADVCVGVE